MSTIEQEAPQSPLNKIEFTEFVFDDTSFIVPSWQEMGDATFQLSKTILESDFHFDRIITLAKSGWTWTRTLADYLNMDDIGTLRIKSYTDINTKQAQPVITQPLSCPVLGENILLFDEIIDSGDSIKMAKQHLLDSGALSVQVATLCYKPHSVTTPDFYAFQTTSWVVLPHEIREFITQAEGKWQKLGYSVETIFDRLISMGLPEEQVSFFL